MCHPEPGDTNHTFLPRSLATITSLHTKPFERDCLCMHVIAATLSIQTSNLWLRPIVPRNSILLNSNAFTNNPAWTQHFELDQGQCELFIALFLANRPVPSAGVELTSLALRLSNDQRIVANDVLVKVDVSLNKIRLVVTVYNQTIPILQSKKVVWYPLVLVPHDDYSGQSNRFRMLDCMASQEDFCADADQASVSPSNHLPARRVSPDLYPLDVCAATMRKDKFTDCISALQQDDSAWAPK